MKRLLLLASITLLALAEQHKTKPKAAVPPPDPEARWMCHIGSYHDCHCPAMVAEQQAASVEQCAKTTQSQKDYNACVAKLPSNCEIIQKADTAHAAHTCKRTCTHAKCQCWDGPACSGPSLREGAGAAGSSDEGN